MDGYASGFQQVASPFGQSCRLLQLAVTAGWLAGNWSAERAHRSCWIAADRSAAVNAALAFLELNGSGKDPEFFNPCIIPVLDQHLRSTDALWKGVLNNQ